MSNQNHTAKSPRVSDELTPIYPGQEPKTRTSSGTDHGVLLHGDYLLVGEHAEEVFVCDDAQVYFIPPNHTLPTKQKPGMLRVVKIPLEKQTQTPEHPTPPAFLEVGSWLYPLIPGQSPILRSPEGYYLFPDLKGNTAGGSVGLVLPANMSKVQRENFESILLRFAALESFPSGPSFDRSVKNVTIDKSSTSNQTGRAQSYPQPRVGTRGNRNEDSPLGPVTDGLCHKIAVGIMAAAEVASRGITYGAVKTAQYVDQGTDCVKTFLPPVTVPTVVEPDVRNTLAVAKVYTGHAVELSGYLVTTLSELTGALASYMAYYAQQATTSAVVQYAGADEAVAKEYLDNAWELTNGATSGLAIIHTGLSHAANTLATCLKQNAVDIVKYCYGPEAGELTETAAESVENVARIGLNLAGTDPKHVIKRAAKETTTAMFQKASQPMPNSFSFGL